MRQGRDLFTLPKPGAGKAAAATCPARSRAGLVIVQRGHAPGSSLSSAVTRILVDVVFVPDALQAAEGADDLLLLVHRDLNEQGVQ